MKPSIRSLKPIFKTNHFSSHLHNAGPITSPLKTRSIIRFRGPDTIKFLFVQGLLTNDVRQFGNENSASSARSVYASILTPQGRFLYDMFLYELPRTDEKLDPSGSGSGPDLDELVLLADVDCSMLDELVETLKKYRLRFKVDIENAGEEFSCWQRFGTIDPAGSSFAQGNNMGWQWHKDPRLDCLGFRGIFPSNHQWLRRIRKPKKRSTFVGLEWGVAEGSIEIPKGEAIPLEYNLAGLNAISFDKGCYVGQELIARQWRNYRGSADLPTGQITC